jgi:hypothetical protein
VKRGRTITILAVLFALSASSFATSCIWGKKFKTHKVCGIVRDVYGAEMPGATVRVERPETEEVVAESQTGGDGSFALEDLAAGDYVIRVKSRGFADASQSFRLVHPDKGEGCRIPVRVAMDVAGRCSGVDNAWKHSLLRSQRHAEN